MLCSSEDRLLTFPGNLVGEFNGYFIPGGNVSKDAFLGTVNQNAYVLHYPHSAVFLFST